MIIEKIGNTIKFEDNNIIKLYPLGSLLLIANDDSNSINVRLIGSRKNVITFDYKSVTNIQSTSATDLVNKLNELIN